MQVKAPWISRDATRAVMAALTAEGARAYFVGGCVRNTIIGLPVNDVDIATDAHPETVMTLAKAAGLKPLPTGIDHGTITVIADGIPHEVTTFRKDVETDGRRAVVAFSDDIRDDARRRDFTMNALYADPDGAVVDPLDGLDDLLARHVRFIDNAHDRIAEDYLRILRFFRFHAWFGDAEHGLDAEGLAACAAAVGGIATLSRERIGAEVAKLLQAPDPRQSLTSMAETGVLDATLPGATPDRACGLIEFELRHHSTPDWLRRLAALGSVDPVANLRLSRRDGAHLRALDAGISGDAGPAELAYRYDDAIAEGVALLRAARDHTPLPWDLAEQIEKGREARFPVAASDLMEKYSGKALGDRLKHLENKWIKSDFEANKESLLNDD